MEITKTLEEGKVIVKLVGYLDTLAAIDADTDFEALKADADKEIVLDLTELEYIASAGLRLLVALNKETIAKGGKVIFKGVNDNIRMIFKAIGFLNIFKFVD